MAITAAEFERARTWILEIAAAVLPGTAWCEVGDERTFEHTGGLSVNRRNGLWYCHAAGRGGCSPIELVRFVKNRDKADATTWVLAFLANHPGTGAATDSTEEGEGGAAAEARRIKAEVVVAATQPLEGTPAETYLRSRGLAPPYPACSGFVPDARVGEGALVGQLEAHGRMVGVQLTYLDPAGRKSLAMPVRRRFNLEKSPGAGFIIPAPTNPPPGSPVTLICEGLEDAMSLAMLEVGQVIGLPGIAALQRLELPKGEVVFVRDGDPTGSSSDKALIAGIDHLLLAGAVVRVTATPAGEDANAILQSQGTAALQQLIADARPAELSLDGDIQRIARLDAAEYECERLAVAKKHRVRLGFVDDTASMYRRRATTQTTTQAAPDTDDEPWEGAPVVLADVLDAALKEIGRYVVAPKTNLATAVLWSAHTHIVHNDNVGLYISPRLAIQAKSPSSGKSTTLRIVSVLSFRGVRRSSVSASSVMRTMQETKRTYCLDEADNQLADRDNRTDLMEILNSGHCRHDSMAERSAPTPDGGWKVVHFNVWGAMAFAGIGELPNTLQERSVRILLKKATAKEVPEHLRDGTSPDLVDIRRQFTAWGDSLLKLPDPNMPDILMRQAGRVGDNWRPLIAVADLAGGQWPALARQAALEEVGAEKTETQVERLLAAINRAFDRQSEKLPANAPDNRDRLRTETLLNILLADHEDDWGTASRGRPISAAWLRERLKDLLEPAGAQNWKAPRPSADRLQCRGYLRLQFTDAWKRHTPGATVSTPPHRAAEKDEEDSSTPAYAGQNQQKSADFTESPVGAGGMAGCGCENASEPATASKNTSISADNSLPGTDGTDGADEMEGPGNIQRRGKRATKKTNGNATKGSAAYLSDEEVEDAGEADLAGLIRVARAANPGRSIKWLAKHVGQPVDIVEIYLGDGAL